MEYDIEHILSSVGIVYTRKGTSNKVTGVSSLEEVTENDVSFCSSKGQDAVLSISKSNAALILCSNELRGGAAAIPAKHSQGLIFVENPRLTFIKAINHMQNQSLERKISPHVLVSRTAKIGSNCRIGDFAVMGDNCSIGDNTIIYDKVW